MSLKNDFYGGSTGLQAQVNDAFNAGVAFVGSSVSEVTDLQLSGVNGLALTQPSAPGLYFDVSSPNANYRFWFFVATETAPITPANVQLVQVAVLGSDTSAIVASKIAAAANLISGMPFDASNALDVVTFTGNFAGPGLLAADTGTLANGSVISVNPVGIIPSGSYNTLQAGLIANAAQGLTHFTITIQTNYNSQYLRGSNSGNCCMHGNAYNSCGTCYSGQNYVNNPQMGNGQFNNTYTRGAQGIGDNLIAKAYFDGIRYGLANQQIYSFDCTPTLNVCDNITTSVDFNFHF